MVIVYQIILYTVVYQVVYQVLVSIILYHTFFITGVEKQFEKFMQAREERAAVSYELQKEKHVLRQMQGPLLFSQIL